MVPRIKICGITRQEDALEAARLGADAVGLVFYELSPRCVTLEQACAVVSVLPPFVTVVALFVNPSRDDVERVVSTVAIDMLQFHGDETPAFCRSFARPYLKAVRVREQVDWEALAREYSDARGLVADAFVEGMPGGTGKTFDWALLPETCALPIIVSGGLDSTIVREAVRLRPAAVDVSSGVEVAKGIKDHAKMAAFILGVRHGLQ